MTSSDPMRAVREALTKARPARPRASIASFIVVAVLSAAVAGAWLDHDQPITGRQLYILKGLVDQTSDAAEAPPREIWQRLYDRFGVGSALELREDEFDPAVEFLAGIAAASA